MASLPLLPDSPPEPQAGSQFVGIARLAAQGEHIRDGHDVEFLTINTKSILNRCSVPWMPFSWTVNPYRGCEFACKYCYARYTHEFMELRDPYAFEQKIYVKQNVVPQLRRDLKKIKKSEGIAIGTATDPYQPAERRYEVTRSVLEEFANLEGYDISIVTKSNLVVRDADVLRRIAEKNKMYVNLTVTTLDADLARLLEPRAPRPDLRLNAVRELNLAGVPAGVICAPVLPGITDSLQQLDALVQATVAVGGKYIYANPLFLKPCSASVFMPFLEEKFPHLVEKYRQRFGEKAFVSEAYRKRISELMKSLRKKYGIIDRREYAVHSDEEILRRSAQPSEAIASESGQMSLF
ncbi:MAG TPA: radical SAM protein [Terriglobales bacterium]|nr:radical SAM protein [Terriglobales bacterium]